MLFVYRRLLRLYPAEFRAEFGDEMTAVIAEARSEARGFPAREKFFLHEVTGLLKGALQAHWRAAAGVHASPDFSSRRFTMRTGFRFPKSTAGLMAVILAGVLLAMEKARSIVRSLPSASAGQADYPDLFVGVVAIFVAACVLAAVAWAGLFAVRRSGVHRLSRMGAGGGKTLEIRDTR